MVRRDYFKEAYEADKAVRFMTVAVRVSRVFDVGSLRHAINQRIARIDDRKNSELDAQAVALITKNIMKAKITKRLQAWRIRPYSPTIKKKSSLTMQFRETLLDEGLPLDVTLSAIYRESGFKMGSSPSILVPGFIPDGNEAFFLLRKCFLQHGSVYYINYPNEHFRKETLFHQMFDMIHELNKRRLKSAGQRVLPFLVGTSFGCRIILSFLQWLKDEGLEDRIHIRGLVLLSPVLCLDDVVDVHAEKQRTLVGRAVAPLYDVAPDDPEALEAAMKKARSIFTKMFQSGAKNLNYEEKEHIPILAIEDDVLRIFDETFSPDSGFFQRYLGLRDEAPLEVSYLTRLPTLVLFAESENDVLAPNSPTFITLSDIQKVQTIFPNGRVEVVYSLDEKRKVTHSDLIFQAQRYRAHLEPWLNQIIG